MRGFLILIIIVALTGLAAAQLSVPQQVTAGEGITIKASDQVLVFGPGAALKKQPANGEVNFSGDEIPFVGKYTVSSGGETKQFKVVAGAAKKVSFIARPSRVPVAKPDVITGVAFVFDNEQNLVLTPTPVKFGLSVDGAGTSRTVTSNNGVAWIKSSSGPREGAAQFVASIPGTEVKRVVQQVASDPCNIRMHVSRSGDQILAETDPIKDCTGNAVPDGTIVTFTQSGGPNGRTTVDARIKKGIARAMLPAANGGTISVASGVVLGNEINVGGGQSGKGGGK
jgi:hypothetical protein